MPTERRATSFNGVTTPKLVSRKGVCSRGQAYVFGRRPADLPTKDAALWRVKDTTMSALGQDKPSLPSPEEEWYGNPKDYAAHRKAERWSAIERTRDRLLAQLRKRKLHMRWEAPADAGPFARQCTEFSALLPPIQAAPCIYAACSAREKDRGARNPAPLWGSVRCSRITPRARCKAASRPVLLRTETPAGMLGRQSPPFARE